MSSPVPPETRKKHTDRYIIFFIILLCCICGFLLALFAYLLSDIQTEAKEFDQSKQMLIAAKILHPTDYFQLTDDEGKTVSATWDSQQKILVESTTPQKASEEEIKELSKVLIRPLFTDAKGNIFTLEEKNLSLPDYLAENKKTGYANLPLKLFYAILPNSPESASLETKQIAEAPEKISQIVIPVSGFGLWAPIYGYIALQKDGNLVMGTTWYEHAETPGLGANIAEPWWQKQFSQKQIFQESTGGTIDYPIAPMGIIVVKGKVKDVYGDSPKSKSAVDGISGATLTGDGVTQAYRDSLTPYRALLMRLQKSTGEKKEGSSPKSKE